MLYGNIYRYTFEVAPVFILMEDVVLKKMREIVGFKGGDGIFTPGKFARNVVLQRTEMAAKHFNY